MYKLSPSKAHRYLQCTKSLEFDTEFVESEASKRGTLLHTIGEMLIKEKENVDDIMDENNLSDYERFLVRAYADAVWEEYKNIGAKQLKVEEKITISLYQNQINLIMDALIIGNKVASVIDLKSGRGDVDPDENEQLIFYGFAVVIKFPSVKNLRLSIFQKGKMKTVEMTKSEILDFFMEKEEVFEKIANNQLEYNPSEKACKFCGNKDRCLARSQWILNGKI
jgi:hypothetical protein